MTSHRYRPTPREALDHDRAVERRMLWKCLLAIAIVVLVVLIRQAFFL